MHENNNTGSRTYNEGTEIPPYEDTEYINPDTIRFSQQNVNGTESIIQSMEENCWDGAPIDIVRMPDGSYTTLDNTRVYAAQQTGTDVLAYTHEYNDPLPDYYIDKFSTHRGGAPAT